MAPGGVESRKPLACTVVRGGALAALPGAVDRLSPTLHAPAVVLVRLSPPTPVSAAVVHAVVDLLHDRGTREVTVAARVAGGDRDRGHTCVTDLARAAGLLGRTARGRGYAVADLDDDLTPAPVPETAVLHGRPCSALWAGAGSRVVVARAVTDLVDGYAGTLATVLGAAPEVPGAEPADVVTELLAHLPVHLVVVDALETAAGADGARLPRPVATDTLVAATDPVLADSALAALLGQDRSASRLVARALERAGPPEGATDGALTALPGVGGPHPRTRAAAAAVAGSPRLERVLRAAVGGPDPGAGDTDPVLRTVGAALTPLVEAAQDAAGALPLESVLWLAHELAHGVGAWSVGADKDRVDRREVPLGFDPGEHEGAAYDGLPEFFAPFDDLLDGLAENADGMRWRMVDGATVFEVEREVRADFDAWVQRVDVAAGISLMADYLGGRRVTVPGASRAGRVRQAERNLYLPQPNYLAAWGGRPIDVCKIELVERDADRHRLTWRTVHSPNGSATYDDGSLTFARTKGGTLATVRGRQLFALPPAWSGVDLAAWPEVRTPLLEEAYRRFFTTTFDNLEACFEGREFRIGRAPAGPDEPLLTRSVDLFLGAAREWVDERVGQPAATVAGEPVVVDAHGFTHVRGPR